MQERMTSVSTGWNRICGYAAGLKRGRIYKRFLSDSNDASPLKGDDTIHILQNPPPHETRETAGGIDATTEITSERN